MVDRIDRTGLTVDAIDVFCGFGGSSQGIHAAGATVVAAANHNELAIRTHAANFPDTDHWRTDLVDPDSGDYVDPRQLPPARFAWFSPGCTHHSQANAQKLYAQGRQQTLPGFEDDDFDEVAFARSERSRVTMSCVLRYVAHRHPEILVVENVVEVTSWGPSRDGSTFRWWLRELDLLGYDVEPCWFNSMFFPPCPQSRDRAYFVAWRKGNTRPDLDYRPPACCTSDRCGGRMVDAVQTWKRRTSAWPLPKWGKYRAQYTYTCPDCRAPVEPVAWPAYTAIDWTNLGPRIGDRNELGLKPLAPKTLERIRRARSKYAGGPPVVIPAKAVWGTDRPVTQPLGTQTAQRDKALVIDPLGTITTTPALALATGGVVLPAAGHTSERVGQIRARSLSDPLFTQHTTQAFGFAHVPVVTALRGADPGSGRHRPVGEELPAVCAGGTHHALVTGAFAKFNGEPDDTAWHAVTDPLNTITARDTTGLVVLPWIDQWRSDPAAITEQLATVMTHARHALAATTLGRSGALDDDAELAHVRFRMLEPDPELRRAMAFGDDYILLGNKTQKTAGLGNAVTPTVASWITERCLTTLADPPPSRVAQRDLRRRLADAASPPGAAHRAVLPAQPQPGRHC
jgi:DNA (cytosine-5)-methyltransferase 1